LHELELNLKAGNILIDGRKANAEDIAKFFTELNRLLFLYDITILPLTCEQIAKAAHLRKKIQYILLHLPPCSISNITRLRNHIHRQHIRFYCRPKEDRPLLN